MIDQKTGKEVTIGRGNEVTIRRGKEVTIRRGNDDKNKNSDKIVDDSESNKYNINNVIVTARNNIIQTQRAMKMMDLL